MPTIRQSVSLNHPELAPVTPAAPAPPPPAPAEGGQSPFMLSSMPLMASTSDLFARQFYGGSRVPQMRILPIVRKGSR